LGNGVGSAGGWREYNVTARSDRVDDERPAAYEKERDFRS
jgi:hypothetical protein